MKSEELPIVNVDGSYLFRKQQSLCQPGPSVVPPPPSPPLSGWEPVTEANVGTISQKVPRVTSGLCFIKPLHAHASNCSLFQVFYTLIWHVVLATPKCRELLEH